MLRTELWMTDQEFPARIETSISFNINLTLHFQPGSGRCIAIFSWQVVKMLIVVVAIFAILWLPHRGLLVYNTLAAYYHYPRYMDLWFLMFAKTCIYINRLLRQYNSPSRERTSGQDCPDLCV